MEDNVKDVSWFAMARYTRKGMHTVCEDVIEMYRTTLPQRCPLAPGG